MPDKATSIWSKWLSFAREQIVPYLLSRKHKSLATQIREIRRIAPFEDSPIHAYLFRRLYETDSIGIENHIPARFVEQFIFDFNARFPSANRPGRWEDGRIGFAIDKLAFEAVMREAGLPTVPILLASLEDKTWINGEGNPVDVNDVESILSAGSGDLFVKKRFGKGGKGALVPESKQIIKNLLKRRHLIVQPRFRQHPDMEALHPGSLNTVRICTFFDETGIEMPCGIVRTGRVGNINDNITSGGIAAPLDLVEGILFKGAQAFPDFEPRMEIYENHPDTGQEIKGFHVPHWQSCLDLVRRGADFIGPGATLGWDLAIGPHGPFILEINDRWDPWSMLPHFDIRATRLGEAAWRAMIREE